MVLSRARKKEAQVGSNGVGKEDDVVQSDPTGLGQWMKEKGKLALQFLPQDAARNLLRIARPSNYRRLQERRAELLAPLDRHRCLFVHIPKCAGTAVSIGLFGQPIGHHTLRYFRYVYAKHEFDGYFKFTFVRNPWDRVVSAFHYLGEEQRYGVDRRWRDEHLSCYQGFEDFVMTGLHRPEVLRWFHFTPQWDYVSVPWSSKSPVDFVGRYENLPHDFGVVAERLGLSAKLAVRNQGRERKADYRSYYSPASRQKVADVYARDIREFGYEF
jgi:hypothetical protein